MKVIIPVAGFGTRLRPHTYTAPKALIHVAGKPILGHIFDSLQGLPCEEIVLVVGENGGEAIIHYAKQVVSVPIRSVVQHIPQGLGDAIFRAREMVEPDEPVLIVLGDTIFEAHLEKPIQEGVDFIGVKPVEDPRRFGVVEVNEEGWVIGLEEKPDQPKSNLAVVGIYHFSRSAPLFEALDYIIRHNIRTKGEFQLTDALSYMIRKGHKMRVVEIEGWYDCGKPETLLETNRILLRKKGNNREVPGSVIIPPVHIEENAHIEASVIGPYVSIAEGAYIKHSVVSDSIVNSGAIIEDAVLDQSIIGKEARVIGVKKRLNVGDNSEVVFG